MRLVLGSVALVTLLALSLVGPTPAEAAVSTRYPVLTAGSRGSEVSAVQVFLYAHGQPSTLDGLFGDTTKAAVIAFQSTRRLPANGTVDAATWGRLLITVSPGDSGPPVAVLQRELDAKRRSGLAIDGRYGSTTRTAVLGFQKHMRLKATGIVEATTWRALLGHYELPVFDATALCDYSVGNGPANWATGESIAQLTAAATAFAATGRGRVAVGDAGLEHGGDIAGHQTHEVGLDVDIRAIRKAHDQCRWGVTWRWSTYDRTATRALIKAIRAAAPGHVKLIYFNDPVLIREGLTTWFLGHDDHLHVRYCEPGYPLAMYRC